MKTVHLSISKLTMIAILGITSICSAQATFAQTNLQAHKSSKTIENTRTISGVITGDGISLTNISLALQNEKQSIKANEDGSFSFEIPSNEKSVIISANEIDPVELSLTDESEYEVTIQIESPKVHQATLYGMPIDRRSFNGSYASINYQDIAFRNAVTIGASIEGVIPGLSSNGIEFGLGGNLGFFIRGFSSFESSMAPLILLDGMPYTGNLSTINPHDIAEVIVLKDGIGKAIYGQRGGNGIIMLYTKSGSFVYNY